MREYFLLIGIFLYLSTSACSSQTYDPQLVYSWKKLDFSFISPEARDKYKAENACPCGIKVNSIGEYFVTVPRFKSTVPSSLNKISVVDRTPLMEPFPSWSFNELGTASNLQSVLGLEIDKNDILWALDQGHVANAKAVEGSLKVVAINSITGEIIDSYVMDSDTANYTTSYLNDLSVDADGGFVYISDTDIAGDPGESESPSPALIILNIKTKTFRRVFDGEYFVNPDPSLWININNQKIFENGPIEAGLDGLALSCDGEILYFSSLTSREMFSVETKYLKDFNTPYNEIIENVIKLGYMGTATDGLLCTRNNNLLMTAIEENGILMAKSISNKPQEFKYKNFVTICSTKDTMMWPNTIGFDNKGKKMVFLSNQLQNFLTGNMDFDNPKYGFYNFRLWEVYIDDQSYVMGCKSDSTKFPAWALALILIFSLMGASMILSIFKCIYDSRQKKKARRLLFSEKGKTLHQ